MSKKFKNLTEDQMKRISNYSLTTALTFGSFTAILLFYKLGTENNAINIVILIISFFIAVIFFRLAKTAWTYRIKRRMIVRQRESEGPARTIIELQDLRDEHARLAEKA